MGLAKIIQLQRNNFVTQTYTPNTYTTFARRNWLKLFALLFWFAIIGAYYAFLQQNNLSIEESIFSLSTWISASPLAPVLYILLYAIGPLFFSPTLILTLLGGFLFGPLGILYTVIGSNSSALVAFFIGRYFGDGVLDLEDDGGLVQRYAKRMRDNSFQTVLIMRLIFLPYSLVNYVCGFLKINWKPFLLATALGSIGPTISIVLIGGSLGTVEELMAGGVTPHPGILILSIVVLVVSLVLSRYLQKREAAA